LLSYSTNKQQTNYSYYIRLTDKRIKSQHSACQAVAEVTSYGRNNKHVLLYLLAFGLLWCVYPEMFIVVSYRSCRFLLYVSLADLCQAQYSYRLCLSLLLCYNDRLSSRVIFVIL